MSSSEPPIFYFDLGSPYAWLAAERIHQVLPVTPVWQPILLGGIWQQTGGQSWAMTERRFAQQTGRTVAFALAAFRQAFAGGKDLSDIDNVLIAAAACELHPNAVLKGIGLQSTKDRLRAATQEAYDRGVRGVPSVVIGDQVFWGDDRLGDAATALTPQPGVSE